MTIEATYRDGVFYPVHPINLPENTRVEVSVAPLREEKTQTPLTSPKITSEEFRARIAKHAASVGTLPPDFSREDIYSDHD
jgi:predicted DNA-binding antitoxin AbrB/MazE fold protein